LVDDQRDDGAVGRGVEDAVATGSKRAADGRARIVGPDGRAIGYADGEDVTGESADVEEVAGAMRGRGGGLVGQRDVPADLVVRPNRDQLTIVCGEHGGAISTHRRGGNGYADVCDLR